MDFSIIIPTYKRPQQLEKCLNSLTNLKYNSFEIIIINDTIEDDIESITNKFKDLNLKLINQKNRGAAGARNTGALIAKGKYLLFIDDDCTVSTYCLQVIKIRFKETSASILTGKTINGLVNNVYSEASQEIVNYLYSYYNEYRGNAKFFTSNNFAITTKCFKDVGGFNEKFYFAGGEDRDLSNRCCTKEYKMIYTPEMKIFHWHKLNFKTFMQQQFNYGRGAYLCTNKKKEPLSFYIKLLIHPILEKEGIEKILITILFLISQVAVVAGLFWEKFKSHLSTHASQPTIKE